MVIRNSGLVQTSILLRPEVYQELCLFMKLEEVSLSAAINQLAKLGLDKAVKPTLFTK